jgi:hypothetical protein
MTGSSDLWTPPAGRYVFATVTEEVSFSLRSCGRLHARDGERTPHSRPDYSGPVPLKIFSNLNLHGATPPRVQPSVGEWGPLKVQSTKQKKRMRIWVFLAFLGSLIAIFLLGWYVYYMMTGSWGFGIGEQKQFVELFLP